MLGPLRGGRAKGTTHLAKGGSRGLSVVRPLRHFLDATLPDMACDLVGQEFLVADGAVGLHQTSIQTIFFYIAFIYFKSQPNYIKIV